VLAPLGALDTGVDRTGGLLAVALVPARLQEAAYQLPAPPVQLPLEVALVHLPGFGRIQKSLGVGENGVGRVGHRTRCRTAERGAADGGPHLLHAEPAFRDPHRRRGR
jgi:hypothetical protein